MNEAAIAALISIVTFGLDTLRKYSDPANIPSIEELQARLDEFKAQKPVPEDYEEPGLVDDIKTKIKELFNE